MAEYTFFYACNSSGTLTEVYLAPSDGQPMVVGLGTSSDPVDQSSLMSAQIQANIIDGQLVFFDGSHIFHVAESNLWHVPSGVRVQPYDMGQLDDGLVDAPLGIGALEFSNAWREMRGMAPSTSVEIRRRTLGAAITHEAVYVMYDYEVPESNMHSAALQKFELQYVSGTGVTATYELVSVATKFQWPIGAEGQLDEPAEPTGYWPHIMFSDAFGRVWSGGLTVASTGSQWREGQWAIVGIGPDLSTMPYGGFVADSGTTLSPSEIGVNPAYSGVHFTDLMIADASNMPTQVISMLEAGVDGPALDGPALDGYALDGPDDTVTPMRADLVDRPFVDVGPDGQVAYAYFSADGTVVGANTSADLQSGGISLEAPVGDVMYCMGVRAMSTGFVAHVVMAGDARSSLVCWGWDGSYRWTAPDLESSPQSASTLAYRSAPVIYRPYTGDTSGEMVFAQFRRSEEVIRAATGLPVPVDSILTASSADGLRAEHLLPTGVYAV